tara:strand:+ start:2298 stop:3038 length:741 start_codon:yes stop_codon:yes gene_type:complete
MEITEELSELVGIIIGDGNIHYNKKTRKYYIEITGNPKREAEYFKYISSLFKRIIHKPGKIRISGRGLRLRVYSKYFVEFLINDLNLHYNYGKAYVVTIPKQILEDKDLTIKCLRGIFDTDGSYFLSDKGYRKDYPCLEITSCSKNLVKQIIQFMKKDFRIKYRTLERGKFATKYVLSLNGELETKKWFEKIGSSNPYKLTKFLEFNSSKSLNTVPITQNSEWGGSSVWEIDKVKSCQPKSTRLKI